MNAAKSRVARIMDLWENDGLSQSGKHRSVGAAGAQVPYKHKVGGSNPSPTTTRDQARSHIYSGLFQFQTLYGNRPGSPFGETHTFGRTSSKVDCSGEIDESDSDNLPIHMNFSESGSSGDIPEELYWNSESVWVVSHGQARELPLADYEELDMSNQIEDTTSTERLITFLMSAKDVTSRKDGDNTIITIEVDAETLSYLYNLYLEDYVSDSSSLKDPVITYMAVVYTIDKDGTLIKILLNINAQCETSDGKPCELWLNYNMTFSELGTAVVFLYGG